MNSSTLPTSPTTTFPIEQMEIGDNLLETIAYNEPTTPIKAAISHLHDYPNGTMPCHWHKELECIVVMEGTLHYYVNDQTYLLNAGDGLVVNSNRLHLCGPVYSDSISSEFPHFSKEENDCKYVVVLLQPDSLRFNRKMEERYINPLLHDQNSDVFYFDNSQTWHATAIHHILSIYQAVTEKSMCFELTAQSEFFMLWKIVYEHAISQNNLEYTEFDPMNPLKTMLSYIQDHYQERITLESIAKSGIMCQSKCCRLFRENLRQSPIEYLQNYRIQRSIDLLDHTDLNITEIALECGFRGASYYTETFRKITGTTPKKYRVR